MSRREITGVAGVPETVLDPTLVAGLPLDVAPAPWTCTCEAVVWLGGTGRETRTAAAEALPASLRHARPRAVVGALVRYSDTPVGRYGEVLGLVAAQDRALAAPWASVAFMAVDSPRSLVGGRILWAMPKTLATFRGLLTRGRTEASSTTPTPWSVALTPRAFGPSVPVRLSMTCRQEGEGGRVLTSRLTGRGRARLALVSVEVESPGTLPRWLRPGVRLGAVVTEATFTLGEPEIP